MTDKKTVRSLLKETFSALGVSKNKKPVVTDDKNDAQKATRRKSVSEKVAAHDAAPKKESTKRAAAKIKETQPISSKPAAKAEEKKSVPSKSAAKAVVKKSTPAAAGKKIKAAEAEPMRKQPAVKKAAAAKKTAASSSKTAANSAAANPSTPRTDVKTENVRSYVYDNHFVPAYVGGQKTISLTVGALLDEMHLTSDKTKTVCGALKKRMESVYGVRILSVEPPEGNGRATTVTYDVTNLVTNEVRGGFDRSGTYGLFTKKKRRNVAAVSESASGASPIPETAASVKSVSSKAAPVKSSSSKAASAKSSSPKAASAKSSSKAASAKSASKATPVKSASKAASAGPAPTAFSVSSGIADTDNAPEKCFLLLKDLESGLRRYVPDKMTAFYGERWYEQPEMAVRADVWKKRRGDKARRSLVSESRQTSLIDYAGFGDYSFIIGRFWDAFCDDFPHRSWIVQRLKEIETIRNAVMHHTSLEKTDLIRLELYISDIEPILKPYRNK